MPITTRQAKLAHARIAMLIGLFLVVHFAAHFSALFGIEAHAQALTIGRAGYQFPLIEVALVATLGLQVILGIGLLRQINARKHKGLWHWVQFLSGCYLAIFIVMHTSAALITRLGFGLDTNFYWAAGTVTIDPIRYGFAPYYTLAITALFGHLIAALHYRRPARWHTPSLILGPVTGILIVMGYNGTFHTFELPTEHLEYFAAFPGVR
ncbi:MAG: hypothetical protein ABJP70_07925 [Erythrobacter sp.]